MDEMSEDKINKEKNLRRAIVETIAFFDLFLFPLTIVEILKYLKLESSYLEISGALDQLLVNRIIEKEDGLYFLTKSKASTEERKKRYNYSDRKFKIALRIAKIFRFVPWVRLICIANLVGRDNLRDSSDIDLFIVGDKDRLWLTRFFCVAIAKILNVRPQKNHTRDKICLSFFVSEDHLDLDGVRENKNDMYFNYWFLNLAPIYSRDSTYLELMKRNKKILESFPNYSPQKISSKRKLGIISNTFYKKNWDLIFGGLEGLARKIQIKIMPESLKVLAPEKKGVIISDAIIKLHLRDKREEFLKIYNENISKYKI